MENKKQAKCDKCGSTDRVECSVVGGTMSDYNIVAELNKTQRTASEQLFQATSFFKKTRPQTLQDITRKFG